MLASAADIEAIERATLAAVSPAAVGEMPGWLLPYDSGTVGRAKSAVPLRHDAPTPLAVPDIERHYAARRLPAIFRVPETPAFQAMRDELATAGYRPGKPTQVCIAPLAPLQGEAQPRVLLSPTPDAHWASVFLGEGFDPVDGASRVKLLSRAPQALFASIREQGATIAGGMMSFSDGWASVHGMRTALAWRRRGLAERVLLAMAAQALAKGYQRVFLQVEAANTAALSVYVRLGFREAWTYRYWQQPS